MQAKSCVENVGGISLICGSPHAQKLKGLIDDRSADFATFDGIDSHWGTSGEVFTFPILASRLNLEVGAFFFPSSRAVRYRFAACLATCTTRMGRSRQRARKRAGEQLAYLNNANAV